MEHQIRPSINRRRLFGIGAAAVAVGVAPREVFAAVPEAGGGFGPVDGPLSNALTAAPIISGASVLALGYSAFTTAYGSAHSAYYAEPASMGTSVEDGSAAVHAPILLPAGARILRIDVVGFRVSPGTQTWQLIRTNLQTGIGRFTAATVVTNSASAEVQGSFTLGPGIVIGTGETYQVEMRSATPTSRAAGVLIQYYPAGGAFSAITPRRVYDSRRDPAGKIVKGQTRPITVVNEVAPGTLTNVVPPAARAIAYNVTITDTEGVGGYLTIVPGGDPTNGPSSINWDSAKQTVANGLIVGVNANREISVLCDGFTTSKTHFIIDVMGYFL